MADGGSLEGGLVVSQGLGIGQADDGVCFLSFDCAAVFFVFNLWTVEEGASRLGVVLGVVECYKRPNLVVIIRLLDFALVFLVFGRHIITKHSKGALPVLNRRGTLRFAFCVLFKVCIGAFWIVITPPLPNAFCFIVVLRL